LSSDPFLLRSLGTERPEAFQPREETVGLRESATEDSPHFADKGLSWWSRSAAKRAFDLAFVVPSLPFVLPMFLLIGLAVRLTSGGPALFLQTRMGRRGRAFTIFKFRTMLQNRDQVHQTVTTAHDPRLTSVGRFLRRWKLDELPQLANVLLGHMSLVRPRPKIPEHGGYELACRPGITGAATIAFACEETMLAKVPQHLLGIHYRTVILPVKRTMDAEYMARATFLTDVRLLANTILRRWDTSILEQFTTTAAFDGYQGLLSHKVTPGDLAVIQFAPSLTNRSRTHVGSNEDNGGTLYAAIGDGPKCAPEYGIGLAEEAGFPLV
jgi:lipopolysaccharide/colanic/teichoic acid biosynthesis glycosyltransferase